MNNIINKKLEKINLIKSNKEEIKILKLEIYSMVLGYYVFQNSKNIENCYGYNKVISSMINNISNILNENNTMIIQLNNEDKNIIKSLKTVLKNSDIKYKKIVLRSYVRGRLLHNKKDNILSNIKKVKTKSK